LNCRNHFTDSFEQIIFGKIEQLCEPLDLLIEKSELPFLTEFENGISLSIMKTLRVLRLKHLNDCVKDGDKGVSLKLFFILSIVKKLVDTLNASFGHYLPLLSRC